MYSRNSGTYWFVICETIPAGVTFNSSYPVFNRTTDCWMRLMNEAQKEIVIGSYYWSLLVQNTGNNYTVDHTNTSGDVSSSPLLESLPFFGLNSAIQGQLIYDTLLKTAQRGVDVKIAQTYQDGGGILHTKSWAVDGKHLYVGSANFDWRALTQVRELGLAVFNCPCLANDLNRLLEIYWEMGAPGAKIPKSWPASLSTSAYHERPTSVPQQKGDQAVYFSVSLDMAVMNYAPCSLYIKPLNKWYGRLDEAIRRAAFDRQVKIRFLFSRWRYTAAKYYSYLHSLADISSQLQCVYKTLCTDGKCTKKGSIDIRIIQVPDMQYGGIPYSRVYHNKYFVTEKAAYIGTSNWTPDYWWYTAGIGMVVRADDVSQKSYLVDQFAQIFERDWNSGMTIPLSYFDNNGKWTNKTATL
ncbi:phospholipase D domain protein [Ancylostoma ceylanicum]|uniref:Phospholipase D domain protein n=1 Tax=Ancylostoma ceylanicum TaxID=53326 RepID=A0A0D6M8X0_9BILA|nr:phospholipase D domain protein [Ancylostoma ceylanicum]